MTRETIIDRLLVLPGALATCERALLDEQQAAEEAAATVQAAQDELLLLGKDGPVNGGNEAIRAAQLRTMTREAVTVASEYARRAAEAKVSLHHLQAEHASLKAIARLLAATE